MQTSFFTAASDVPVEKEVEEKYSWAIDKIYLFKIGPILRSAHIECYSRYKVQWQIGVSLPHIWCNINYGVHIRKSYLTGASGK